MAKSRRWVAKSGRWVAKSGRWVAKSGRWVATGGRWGGQVRNGWLSRETCLRRETVAKSGRWVAKLIARLIALAAQTKDSRWSRGVTD